MFLLSTLGRLKVESRTEMTGQEDSKTRTESKNRDGTTRNKI